MNSNEEKATVIVTSSENYEDKYKDIKIVYKLYTPNGSIIYGLVADE